METKIKIIDVLDKNKKGIHLRELSRLTKTNINNLSRNLKILEKENVIKKEKDGNMIKISLKNNPLTVAYLKKTHTENFISLPKKIIYAIEEFIDELEEKPLIILIFGSYAKQSANKNSDIDILLIYQKIIEAKHIENTVRRVNMRNNTKISPVYVEYADFKKNFLDKTHDFSNEIRQNVIVLRGIEYYYDLCWRFFE